MEMMVDWTKGKRCREQGDLHYYTIFKVQCSVSDKQQCSKTDQLHALPQLRLEAEISAVASSNWLFIPSVNGGQRTDLVDPNVGNTGRTEKSLWASWACSSCMNNSRAAEFSCVWINTMRIHRRCLSEALIFHSVINRWERQSSASLLNIGLRVVRTK